jgi:glucose-1-phosphate thymidylyltransferase
MTAPLAVILAAGRGTRLAPISERYPKPVLPVMGKPLIEHQLESLREAGVERTIVVVGHLGFELARVLGDGKRFGMEVEYVDQGPVLGTAHALATVEDRVDRPFLLLLADIFFITTGLGEMVRLLGQNGVEGVLAVKEESEQDAIRRNFVVIEDAAGSVRRVVEKPRFPTTRLKGSGVYLFDPVFFDAVRRTPRTALRDEYELTDAIQTFVDDGHRVVAARVIERDVNLTFADDLLHLNLELLGNKNLIGQDVSLPEGCRLERCILMDGSRVIHPIRLSECLVFPGATVDSTSDLRRHIITRDRVFECR